MRDHRLLRGNGAAQTAPGTLECVHEGAGSLDGLKSINDLNGHAAGDAALKAVVDALRADLRSFDPVLRYGGDEFVAGMGGVDLDDAERRFEAIKVTLRQDAAVGISVGIAALAMGETLDELIARADSALLRRRRSARDSTPAG